MSNIVDIQVTDLKVILKIPQKDIVHEVDNVAAFDSETKKLLQFGLTPNAYQARYPKKWEKQKDKMEFMSIFSKDTLSPEAGAMLLWDWWSQVSRYVVPQYVVFKHQVKLEINIFFENYEAIQDEQREEFEFLVFRFLYTQKLTVNGVEKHIGRREWLPGSLYSCLTFVIGLCFILLSVIPTSFALVLIPDAKISALLSFFLYTFAILGSIVIAVYLGNFIASLLWLLILKPFFGRKILLRSLSYSNSEPRRRKVGWIENLFFRWLLPE